MKHKSKGLLCKQCKQPMILDDVDYNFKGNRDELYACEKCQVCATVKVRYGRRVKIEWFDYE